MINGEHFFRYNNIPQAGLENIKLAPLLRKWYHYCHVMNDKQYILYIDGAQVAADNRLGNNRYLALNGTLVIGQEQDSISLGCMRLSILEYF